MSNPNGKSAQDSYLKTKKKGNVTVNPKKEDLMSELYSKNLKSALQEIKEKAVTAANTTKQKEKVKGQEKVEPATPCAETKEPIDDSATKAEIQERMRQRLLQLTQEHDSKYMIDIKQGYIQSNLLKLIMINFLMPIAISIINKAVDRIPEDLDSVIKDFVIKLLKKAAAKTENKVDDELVAAVAKALLESQCL